MAVFPASANGATSKAANSLIRIPPMVPLCLLLLSAATQLSALIEVDLKHPVVDVTPIPLSGHSSSRDVVSCERVLVSGVSRLKLGSYASAYRVTLIPSAVIPERLHGKIQICSHKNSSLDLCKCQQDDWKSLQKGAWSSVMSPYEDRLIDVKYVGDFMDSVTVTIEEDPQNWRLVCLAMGMILLLLAPIVSSWVPFYYSSSMMIGICLVIIILLFQAMKLLPTGRKNMFYVTIYGSMLGAGSFLLHHFSMVVNSILLNFGLDEELHNPVSIFVLVGVILSGAGFGYWLVRKYVVSENGNVDTGVAQFVKWAIRIIGITFVFQSTLDTPLAIVVLGLWCLLCSCMNSMRQRRARNRSVNARINKQLNLTPKRAEFYKKSKRAGIYGSASKSPMSSSPWSGSPLRGLARSNNKRVAKKEPACYYSTYHKTPNRKRFSAREWEEFTQESTKSGIAELASSPEFADWIMKNADRVKVVPEESSDETVDSRSDDDSAAESCSGVSFFKWQR
ncbi:unnamed protein product [Cuscuta epithymum]|uniref:Uncharacterized protein n=1 Tax=Cuscuta epithymum TaxID=186058 RepID=A0AAV0C758_9ASTE|nr:unnamed protein product [Cuscuta epithymum]